MAELIRQVRPAWTQLQQLELPLPPHALRTTLLALGTGLLLMAGLASLSTFWAPTRAWWEAAEHGSAMAAGVQASLLAGGGHGRGRPAGVSGAAREQAARSRPALVPPPGSCWRLPSLRLLLPSLSMLGRRCLTAGASVRRR